MSGLSHISKIDKKNSELKRNLQHWLAFEIYQCRLWISNTSGNKTRFMCTDVTEKQFDSLAKEHIRFCEIMMTMFCGVPKEQIDEVVKYEMQEETRK